LVTNDGENGAYAALTDAALVISGGRIGWTGPAARAPAADAVVDVAGRAVLPGFADSHAHLVFAGERSAEFAARMAGRPYRAGGILVTVEATRAAPDAVLRANLRRLAAELGRPGGPVRGGAGGPAEVPPRPGGFRGLGGGPVAGGRGPARPVDRRVLRGR